MHHPSDELTRYLYKIYNITNMIVITMLLHQAHKINYKYRLFCVVNEIVKTHERFKI